MKCSEFNNNISAFLDGELDLGKKKEMEDHLSECNDCRMKAKKLKEMVVFIKGMRHPDPESSSQLWEATRKRIEKASEHSTKREFKWVFVPTGITAFAILVYLLSGTAIFYGKESVPISVDVCLQEHSLFYSEQVLPSDILPDLHATEQNNVAKIQSDEDTSEMDMLLEAHYGII